MSHEQPALPAPPEGVEFMECNYSSRDMIETYTFPGRADGRRAVHGHMAHTKTAPRAVGLRLCKAIQISGGGYKAPGWGRLFPGVAYSEGPYTASHSEIWLVASAHVDAITVACQGDIVAGDSSLVKDGPRVLQAISQCRAETIPPSIADAAMAYAAAINDAAYLRQEADEANRCRDLAVTLTLSRHDLITEADARWLADEQRPSSGRYPDYPRRDWYQRELTKRYRQHLDGAEVVPTPPPEGFDPFDRYDRRYDAREAVAKAVNGEHEDAVREIAREAMNAIRAKVAASRYWYMH